MIQSSQESYGFAYGGHRCCRQVFIVIEAFLAVAVRVEIFQQTSGEENQRNSLPRNRMHKRESKRTNEF